MNEDARDASASGPSPNVRDEAIQRVRRPGVLVWIERVVPNLLVLSGLAAFAYWGHKTGWKLPKFSELAGAAVAKEEKWCDEHNVPEALCVECNPTRFPKPKSFGWCEEHGVADCPLHHPEIAQLASPSVVVPADLERARQALKFTERPENSPDSKVYERRVQFASTEAFEKTGIDVRPVRREHMVESVAANGEVVYDRTRMASLSAPAAGRVWQVYAELGRPVKAGEILAVLDAGPAGAAKAAFLQALVQVEAKERSLKATQALAKKTPELVPELTLREAESQLREAQTRQFAEQQALVNLGLPVRVEDFQGLAVDEAVRRIQFIGLPESLVKTLDPRATTANLVPVRAPLGGVVTACDAVAGEQADPSRSLFVVADVSRVWVTLDLRAEDARRVAVGQAVRLRPDGYAGKDDLPGTIGWVGTAADEKTRTVKARAELPNLKGDLRANTFVSARVILREEKDALVVPTEALHQLDGCNVVFVRDKDFLTEGSSKVFHVREVRPGAASKDGKLTEIIVGLLPGEVVASRGSDVLRAQLMKDQLGGDD